MEIENDRHAEEAKRECAEYLEIGEGMNMDNAKTTFHMEREK